MSFAIKWGDEAPENAGFIYFDAVTGWQQNYSGKVTSHPVDGGSNISDHFIRDNPRFTLSGVISSIDISINSWLIADPTDENTPSNVRVSPASVSVQSTDKSVLTKYIPNSVGQFIADTAPIVLLDERDSGKEIVDSVKDALIRLVYSGKTYNETTGGFDSIVNTVTLYEYEGRTIIRVWPEQPTEKIVVVGVSFKEDAGTGSGLYCDIAFEQVEFVSLQSIKIPKRVAQKIANKAATKKAGGKCDSSVNSSTDPNNTDSQSKKDGIEDSTEKVGLLFQRLGG